MDVVDDGRNDSLPLVEEVQAISEVEVANLLDIDTGSSLELAEIGLGWYRALEADNLWFGVTGNQIHDHDRWLLAIELRGAHDSAKHYYKVRHEVKAPHRSMFGPTRLIEGKLPFRTVRNYLDDILLEAYNVNRQRAKTGAPVMDTKTLLLYTQLLESSTTELLAGLPVNLDFKDSHMLLHHYATWLAAHPEAAELPQELALRAHGLGGVWA